MPDRTLNRARRWPTSRRQWRLQLTAGALLLAAASAGAQTSSSLPAASRTAFKCVVAGKVSYSDAPCPDAQRLELQPTRGMDKSSGRTMTGADVRNEQFREQLAEAIKPVTGLTPAQFEVHRRRMPLPGAAKSECASLDRGLPAAELAASEATHGAEADQTRRELFATRQRYRALGC